MKSRGHRTFLVTSVINRTRLWTISTVRPNSRSKPETCVLARHWCRNHAVCTSYKLYKRRNTAHAVAALRLSASLPGNECFKHPALTSLSTDWFHVPLFLLLLLLLYSHTVVAYMQRTQSAVWIRNAPLRRTSIRVYYYIICGHPMCRIGGVA